MHRAKVKELIDQGVDSITLAKLRLDAFDKVRHKEQALMLAERIPNRADRELNQLASLKELCALGKAAEPYIDVVGGALRHPNGDVKTAAMQAMGKFPPELALRFVMDIARGLAERESDDTRRAASECLLRVCVHPPTGTLRPKVKRLENTVRVPVLYMAVLAQRDALPEIREQQTSIVCASKITPITIRAAYDKLRKDERAQSAKQAVHRASPRGGVASTATPVLTPLRDPVNPAFPKVDLVHRQTRHLHRPGAVASVPSKDVTGLHACVDHGRFWCNHCAQHLKVSARMSLCQPVT